MDGVLIIDKPAGLTSHDVVQRVRRIFKTKRVGHTGTLDPFATGVLVVLIGRATRLARFLDSDLKEYEAELRFGFETDTGDLTGAPRPDTLDSAPASLAALRRELPNFLGVTEQLPPMYSAKKIDGQKLYELARKGIEVDRKPVKIRIYKLEIATSSDTGDAIAPDLDRVSVRVICSAGTYIRTLAEDIARRIGSAAHLTALRRISAGSFDIEQAIALDSLGSLKDSAARLLPIDTAVSHLQKVVLPAERIERARQGLSSRLPDAQFDPDEPIRILDEDGSLVGVGYFDPAENSIRPKIVLV